MASHQKKIKLYWITITLFSLFLLTLSEAIAQIATVRFSFSAYTVNEASGFASVSVARSGNTVSQVSVDYSTSNGTALDGSDYNAVSGTLTFLSGETKKTFSVPIIDDVLNENNETISLTLSNPLGGAALGTPNTATLIIIDNDPAPSLSINDVAVTEGNSGTVDAVFTVSLSTQSGKTVFIDYGVGSGTASAGSDFFPNSGSFSFLPGETSKTITVTVNGDVLNEADETFNVVLSSAVNANLTKSIGVGTILNDDPAPTISINDISVAEGNSGVTNADFTLTLSALSGQAITVSYTTADGTASAGSDYTASSGTVTFFPGETSKTLTIAVNGDISFEPDETFAVNLSNPSVGTISRSKGSCTILNDDAMPSISINGVSLAEGNSGTSNAVFTVVLSAPSSDVVTVNFATANGTAVAGTDYVAASGTLTFAPGATSSTVTVLVNGNTIYQPDKIFFVNLSAASNATLGAPQATGTILNDDVCPTITLGQATLPNGIVGAVYNQTMSASGGTAPYAFTVSSGTLPAGLTLSVGALSGTPTAAATSTFTITATDANGCMGSTSYTMVVNQIPSITINDISVTEFNKGTVNAVFTVTLSFASTQAVTINYATANGTATAGTDYTAKSGTLTFAPGTTTQTITILVNGDRKKETNETFTVTLSNPVNSTIGTGTGTCTIVNDDGLPKIHINNESIAEGNNGTKQMVFTVYISKKWNVPVTVDYATADVTAQAGSDYVATSGTLTFAVGENKKTIAVTINGDTVYEPDEQFTVNLSNPTNARIGDDQAKGTIHNDDQKPKIAIDNISITEGNSGTTPAIFTVTLSNPSSETVKVRYETDNGSAEATNDYTAVSGTIMFNPGETSKTVTVLIKGDTTPEKDEEFTVRLSKADNASIDEGKGTCKIINDDVSPVPGKFSDLISYIQSLPLSAFKSPADRKRGDLIDEVNEARKLYDKGKFGDAQKELNDVLGHISGSNSWVVSSTARQDIQQKTSDLIASIAVEASASSSSLAVGPQNQMSILNEEQVVVQVPTEFTLSQNYPNPFNPSTTIRYAIAAPTNVKLQIYNALGEVVATLVDREQVEGTYQFQWQPNLPSGVYFYRLIAGGFVETKRMILMK